MTPTGKIVTLITTLGTLGGAGAYASSLFNSPQEQPKIIKINIRNKLTSEGFEILDTNVGKNVQEWKAVLEEYKKATDRSFTKKKEADKKEEDLRKDCAGILDQENITIANYTLAKQWCVKKETIKAILGKGKYKLLNFANLGETTEKDVWTEKVKALRKDTSKFESIKSKIKNDDNSTDANIKALKEECKALKIDSIETTNDLFEKNFDLARDWCSVKNNDTNI